MRAYIPETYYQEICQECFAPNVPLLVFKEEIQKDDDYDDEAFICMNCIKRAMDEGPELIRKEAEIQAKINIRNDLLHSFDRELEKLEYELFADPEHKKWVGFRDG